MNDLAGKVAFITGAAQGQGRATALALAQEGVHIVAVDLAKNLDGKLYPMGSRSQLEKVVEDCNAFGIEAVGCAADVRSHDEIKSVVELAHSTFKRIDILFNNAGICFYGKSHELAESEWDKMLDINLKGAWICAKHIIPMMIDQGSGVIINNSSVGGLRGMNRLSHYAASKWGLIGLTKSWAIELAPYNIRSVSIHPTGVNTPMNDGLAAMEGKTTQEIAEASAGNLLDVPWIEPEDVAQAVVYLCSDKARFITGSQFVIDAGLLSR